MAITVPEIVENGDFVVSLAAPEHESGQRLMLSGTIGVDGGTRADRLAATQAALDELQVVLVPLGWTVQASERGDWVRQVTPTPDPEG